MWAVLFDQFDQIQLIVKQVFQAAVKVPVGQYGSLQPVVLGSSGAQLSEIRTNKKARKQSQIFLNVNR